MLHENRTEKLDLRLTPDSKHLLQVAAATAATSVSDFVLQSAMARAAETLPNRIRFGLDAKQWQNFLSALDGKPRALPRLSKLAREKISIRRRRK